MTDRRDVIPWSITSPTSFEAYRSTFNRNDACGFLDREIASGTIDKFIFVCVNIGTPLANSWAANSPVTGNWDDFIAKELVSYVDATFKSRPASDSRRGRRVHGGDGAIRVAIAHPDVFGSVYGLHPVGTGSGVQIMHGRPDWDALGRAKSLDDVKGNGYGVIFTGIFQAFLPNPEKPPLFVDLAAHREGKRLVVNSKLTERLRHNFFLESLDIIGNKESVTTSTAACASAREGCAIHKPLPSPNRRPLPWCSGEHLSQCGSVSPQQGRAPL